MQSILTYIEHRTFNTDLSFSIDHLATHAKYKMTDDKWSGATHAQTRI